MLPKQLDDTATLEDMLGHLSSLSATLKAVEADPRPEIGPRIPIAQDRWQPVWKPPPDKRNIAKSKGQTVQPEFVRFVKTAGDMFHVDPGFVRGKILETRVINRLGVPDRTFAHLPAQIRYHAQPEPMPAPTDDMCTGLHQKWLQKHHKARDKYVYEVYHALNKVDKAQSIIDEERRRRELAREAVTSGALELSKMSEAARRGILKLKRAVKSSRAFRDSAKDAAVARGDKKQAHALDIHKQQTEKNQAYLEKCKSAPCLHLRPPTPYGQVKHLRAWAAPNRSLRLLKETTPLRERDDLRELQRLGRITIGMSLK